MPIFVLFFNANICLLSITVMKELLFVRWTFFVLSCSLVSCSNDKLAAVVLKRNDCVVLTLRQGVNSRAAFDGGKSECFYPTSNPLNSSAGCMSFPIAHSVEGDSSLVFTNIEKQGQVFTAGRAWLSRGEVDV